MQLSSRELECQPGKRALDVIHRIPTTDNSMRKRTVKAELEICVDERKENREKNECKYLILKKNEDCFVGTHQ